MLKRLGWLDTYRNLGDSALELVKAEAMLILNDSKRWLFHAARVGVVVVLAMIVLAYLPFLMLLSAVDGVAQWTGWNHWLASLTVLFGVCLSIALLFVGVYFWSAKKLIEENPVAVFERRLDDHQGWWRHQVPQQFESVPAPETVGDDEKTTQTASQESLDSSLDANLPRVVLP